MAEHVHETRWWSREDLGRSEATFAPRALPSLMAFLVDDMVPAESIVIAGFSLDEKSDG